MSRSNHHYFNTEKRDWEAFSEMRKAGFWCLPDGTFPTVVLKPEREIVGRRTWRRKARYPENRVFGAVPRWYRRHVNRISRRVMDAELRRRGAEAEMPDMQKWGAGRIAWFY